MKISPIEKTDRQGRSVIIRSAEEKDAESLLKYMIVTAKETPYLIREADEITMTLEEEIVFLQKRISSERELLLIAEINGEHVGSCSLMSMLPYKRFAHRCEVAIALYQDYCGSGIGELLMNTLLDSAKKMGYEQAELEVVSDNYRALALYKKLGFAECGHLPRNMRYSDGTYADAERMIKML